jgi:hypothetical protein
MKDKSAMLANNQNNTDKALKFAFQEHTDIRTRPLIETLTSIEDLTNNIAILDEIKDNALGIKRYTDGENIVRDASNVTQDKKLLKKDAGEKYAMQVLNQVRGAILLIEADGNIQNKEQHISQLLALAENSLTETDKLPKKIKSYNSAMVSILETAGVTEASEKLNFAKEIASFKDTHKNIITLTKQGENTIAEADVIIELTDEQKNQYQQIANGQASNIAWYNKLPDYQKALIKNVAGDIATGKKVIPAQMRDLMGLRNAYEKTTAIKKKGETTHTPIVQSIHCGAPTSENEHDKEGITQANIEQLKAHANGSRINLNILSSFIEGNIFAKKDKRKENWITEGLNHPKDQQGVTTTSSSINRWRLVSAKTEHNQFDLALKSLGTQLEAKSTDKKNKELIEYIKTGKGSYKTALKQIDHMPEDQRTALKAAIHARKNLGKWNIFKTKNINLEISADMLIVETAIDKGGLSSLYDNQQDKQKTVSFCKSGKDRTGLVELIATKNAVRYELGLSSKESIKYLETLAAGGHTQEMAGIQGGTIGNHSIKMPKKAGLYAEFSLPMKYWSIDGIINQKSAGYNSKIKQAKDKEEQKEAENLIEKTKTRGKLIKQKRKTHQQSATTSATLDKLEADLMRKNLENNKTGTSLRFKSQPREKASNHPLETSRSY